MKRTENKQTTTTKLVKEWLIVILTRILSALISSSCAYSCIFRSYSFLSSLIFLVTRSTFNQERSLSIRIKAANFLSFLWTEYYQNTNTFQCFQFVVGCGPIQIKVNTVIFALFFLVIELRVQNDPHFVVEWISPLCSRVNSPLCSRVNFPTL